MQGAVWGGTPPPLSGSLRGRPRRATAAPGRWNMADVQARGDGAAAAGLPAWRREGGCTRSMRPAVRESAQGCSLGAVLHGILEALACGDEVAQWVEK